METLGKVQHGRLRQDRHADGRAPAGDRHGRRSRATRTVAGQGRGGRARLQPSARPRHRGGGRGAQRLNFRKPSAAAMATPGKAVTARLSEGFVSVGSPRYAAEQTDMPEEVVRPSASAGGRRQDRVVVLAGKRVLGVIAMRDEPREDAAGGVARLNALRRADRHADRRQRSHGCCDRRRPRP